MQEGPEAQELPGGDGELMVDQDVIIDTLVRTVRAHGEPRGMLWTPLVSVVVGELCCTVQEANTAVLAAVDAGLLQDDQVGWLRIPEARLQAEAEDVALDRHIENQEERRKDDLQRHDENIQHAAEDR